MLANISAPTTPPVRYYTPRRPRPKPPEFLERLRLAIYLYRSGISASGVAVALGISKQRVLELLRNAGVERRACGNTRRDSKGHWASLLGRTLTDEEKELQKKHTYRIPILRPCWGVPGCPNRVSGKARKCASCRALPPKPRHPRIRKPHACRTPDCQNEIYGYAKKCDSCRALYPTRSTKPIPEGV